MGLGFSQVVFLAHLHRLYFFGIGGTCLFGVNLGRLLRPSLVGSRRGFYWAGRRPSSSPCDRINCVLDDDSPLGFAVILSPVGEGWAVGCLPEQFLRQTQLIKRSLWLDDDSTWRCLEPLHL